MKKIGIYYHVWCPVRSQRATKLIKNQLDRIKSSGVLTVAEFNCVITGASSNFVKAYIKKNYPFVRIRSVVPKETIAENHTLRVLYKDATENKYQKVFYFHTKGMSQSLTKNPAETNTRHWRLLMELMLITNWKTCVDRLRGNDTFGILLRTKFEEYVHYSGNFWWAKSSYIKKLYNPVDKAHIAPHKALSARHSAEAWLGTGNGKMGCLMNTPNINECNLYQNDIFDVLSGQPVNKAKPVQRDKLVRKRIKKLQNEARKNSVIRKRRLKRRLKGSK